MKAIAAAAVALALAPPAAAQDPPRADVFAGYSALAGDGDARHGWHAALGWPLGGRLSLVLDASGHGGRDVEGTDVDALALMAGPRLAFSRGRLRPFVHVIAGLLRTRASVGVFEVEISESANDFGGAAGGGLDFGLGERWAARGAADYRAVRSGGETIGDPRFSIGVVHRFRR